MLPEQQQNTNSTNKCTNARNSIESTRNIDIVDVVHVWGRGMASWNPLAKHIREYATI